MKDAFEKFDENLEHCLNICSVCNLQVGNSICLQIAAVRANSWTCFLV